MVGVILSYVIVSVLGMNAFVTFTFIFCEQHMIITHLKQKNKTRKRTKFIFLTKYEQFLNLSNEILFLKYSCYFIIIIYFTINVFIIDEKTIIPIKINFLFNFLKCTQSII